MPYRVEPLDSSYVKEENIVIILGRNILLKIIESAQTRALLDDEHVKRFVSTENLCNDEIRSLIDNLIEKEQYIKAPSLVRKLIEEKDELEMLGRFFEFLERVLRDVLQSSLYKSLEKKLSKDMLQESISEEILSDENFRADLLLRVKGQITEEQIRTYEKELLSIDKEIEQKAGFRLTIPSTLMICPNCNGILYDQEIANGKCYGCNAEISHENVKRVPIYEIPNNIKSVWQSNLWFEAYVANLLQKLDFRTWTNVHVMGASGILHEIDVLAIRKGTILVCECKTGNVSRNSVFNFCTKIGDLKTHISVLALIRGLPEPETREFIKKIPAIIRLENMGKSEETEILDELRRRLSIKAA